jgi:hypothetical protein
MEHRIRWYARVGPCTEAPDGWLPRSASFRGTWGWDVRCSCGLETRTGGATRRHIQQLIWEHKNDYAVGGWYPTQVKVSGTPDLQSPSN